MGIQRRPVSGSWTSIRWVHAKVAYARRRVRLQILQRLEAKWGPAPQDAADEAAEIAAAMPPAACAGDADFAPDPDAEETRSPETRANA